MNLLDFKQILPSHNPCEEGLAAFNKCKSRKDVFELIGQPAACDFFLQSIEQGWGPSPDDIESIFRSYINGALTISYKMNERKFRSQIWCKADDIMIDDNVRWLILVGCKGKVTISRWQVVKVFVDANSSIDLECSEDSIVQVVNYGGIVRNKDGNAKFKDRKL